MTTSSPGFSVASKRVEEHLLAAGRDHDLGGVVVEAVLAARTCPRWRGAARGCPRARCSGSRRGRSPPWPRRGCSRACRSRARRRERLMMSRPCAFSSRARAVIATVGDGLMRASASERKAMIAPVCRRAGGVLGSGRDRGKPAREAGWRHGDRQRRTRRAAPAHPDPELAARHPRDGPDPRRLRRRRARRPGAGRARRLRAAARRRATTTSTAGSQAPRTAPEQLSSDRRADSAASPHPLTAAGCDSGLTSWLCFCVRVALASSQYCGVTP